MSINQPLTSDTDDLDATILNQGKDVEAQQAIPVTSNYVVMTQVDTPAKRKKCGGCCCCFTLLIFLLLFFLIPRNPTVSYHGTTVNDACSDDTIDECYLIGEFTFKNENYYDVTWSKMHITLSYWNTNTNGWTYLGVYEKDDSFDTELKSKKELEVPLTGFSGTQAAAIAYQIYQGGYVYVKLSGQINADSALKDFGKISLNIKT